MANLPIAVLISGGGTTLRNLIRLAHCGNLPVEFRLLISSRSSAAGLDYARAAHIENHVISRRLSPSPEAHSESIFGLFRNHGVELVVMGGYLEHLLIPADFRNRVINIHPSLIPAFCGQGFYGLRVHQAVIDYGAKLSGCTVHYVDNQFDHGPIIAQRACDVLPDDTAETLQARVFKLECQLYPETISAIASGRVTVVDRQVIVKSAADL